MSGSGELIATLAGAAFLVGLLGGVHCVAMCGGITASLARAAGSGLPAWQVHSGYNLGRIASYGAAGAAVGTLGGGGLLLRELLPVQLVFFVLANVLLVGLGLYLGGWSRWIVRLEEPGRWLWRVVQPQVQRLVPVNTWPKALAAGVLWGWLPCGLVYSLLASAMLAGSPTGGAAVMLAFGLGTLPNLLGAGLALERMRALLAPRTLRRWAGALVAGFGVVGLVRAADLGDHIRRGLLCLI